MNDEPERFRVVVSPPRQGEWWDQARSELEYEPERVPELALPLLGRQVRSELMSREDALTIRDWAESLPGWEDERRLVLLRHASQATIGWRDLQVGHPLESSLVKVARACEHIHELKDRFVALVESETHHAVHQMDLETGEYWVRLRVAPPPSYISTSLGDFAHNARGALDNLVWALVLRNRGGREPESEAEKRRVQFPIQDPERWSYDLAALRFLTHEQRALIESVQPHIRAGDQRAPLAFLRDLSNTDKHREIEILVNALHPDNQPTINLVAFRNCGQLLDPRYVASSGPLEDGTPLAYLRFSWLRPDSEVDVEIEITVDPMIRRGDRLIRLYNAVNTILHEVRWVVASCREYFPPPPSDFPSDLWATSLARPS